MYDEVVDPSPDLQDLCGLVGDCAVQGRVGGRGGDHGEHAGGGHQPHGVARPAVQLPELVVGPRRVAQHALTSRAVTFIQFPSIPANLRNIFA